METQNKDWRVIPGLESYAINADGVIKALPKIREGKLDCLNNHEGCIEKSQRKYKEHIIKPRYTARYWYVCLMHNGIKKDYRVHRLVYQAFIGDIPNGMVIDHIDGDRNNNNINNLRCVTSSENKRNPVTRYKNRIPVIQYEKESERPIAEYPCAKAAADELGISPSNLYKCLSGKISKCKGFIWKYKKS